MPKKTIDTKLLTAQELIDVEEVSDGIIYSRSGYLFGFLRVNAGSHRLLDSDEAVARAEQVTQAMATTGDDPIQIISVPRTIDTVGMIATLHALRKTTDNDAKLRLINGEVKTLQAMARDGTKEPMIVIKCWIKAARGADRELLTRLKDLCSRLSENRVNAALMETAEVIYLCKLFGDLGEYHDSDEEIFEDIPMLPGKKRPFTKHGDLQDDAEILRNLITPVGGLFFDVSRVHIGAVTGRVYAAMRYPSELEYGWAVELVNSSDCVTAITYYPGNPSTLGDALSASINRNVTNASSERNARARMRYERQASDAEQMVEEIDFKNSTIGHISILAMPFSSDEAAFEDVCRAVSNRFSKKKLKIKPLGSIQKEAFQSLTPYHVPHPTIEAITKQIMPLQSLMGGFPMTVNIFRDSKGCYFGKTPDGGIISLDITYRGDDRTNGNVIATGAAGQGKSTALKHLIESAYMSGIKIIILDVEREYRDLCIKLNGTWLDVGGGNAKVNPFQIRPIPPDDEDEKNPLYVSNSNAMALHLRTLEVFFALYLPGLDALDKALLKEKLIELYNSCGIDWDTDVAAVPAEQFPTAQQLHTLMAKGKTKDARLEKLETLIRDMAVGADSFLFNGHTNVDISNGFIVLDTNRIASASDNLKQAQYFNNLTMVWEIMSANRKEPVLVLCDEAHTMFEPKVLQTAMYLRNMAKRARKYEGYLVTVFQSVNDVLFPQVRLYGEALLDNATYKIIFGCDGKNLQDTVGVLNLTDQEKKLLEKQQREHALFIAGSQHMHVHFEIPQYKLDLMGEGGGR